MEIDNILSKIQSNLNVGKNRNNTFGGYKYRSCEDIFEGIKKIMPEDACLVVSDEVIHIGERYFIKATAVLLYKGTERVATGWAREAEEKKGMDVSQVTGAASSYARKYALCGLFAIDDGNDADSSTTQSPPPQRTMTPQTGSSLVSDKQLKRMFAIANKHGKAETLKQLVKEIAGVDSSKELTRDAYEEVIKRIES